MVMILPTAVAAWQALAAARKADVVASIAQIAKNTGLTISTVTQTAAVAAARLG